MCARKYLIKRWFAQVSGTREVEKQLRWLETLSDFRKTVSILAETLTVFRKSYRTFGKVVQLLKKLYDFSAREPLSELKEHVLAHVCAPTPPRALRPREA